MHAQIQGLAWMHFQHTHCGQIFSFTQPLRAPTLHFFLYYDYIEHLVETSARLFCHKSRYNEIPSKWFSQLRDLRNVHNEYQPPVCVCVCVDQANIK